MRAETQRFKKFIFVGLLSMGLGYALGLAMGGENPGAKKGQKLVAHEQSKQSLEKVEDLRQRLSDVMLPRDEYFKLSAAIYQTGMGLLNAQAQNSGQNIDSRAENRLKKLISEKYSRSYFTEMNAESMSLLEKEDLKAILSFYGTDAGIKFLKISPEVIANTMGKVRADMAKWLPQTINKLLADLKAQPKKEGLKADPNRKLPAQAFNTDY